MVGILKDHYLMFCSSTFSESEFLAWVLSLDVSDLKLVLEQFGIEVTFPDNPALNALLDTE